MPLAPPPKKTETRFDDWMVKLYQSLGGSSGTSGGSIASGGVISLAPAGNVIIGANQGAYAPSQYEIANGYYLEIANGAVFEIG